ncbi:urea transporter 1 isoform X2 [Salvelinus fontinalis]|uniref:urea transporter 1 isoform X2 n=1 Tax=Salvelinus fontinalis TaxID=8038 RepID=UPI0024853978|nr:urea transporter 1 isoform X2 [Salvelinus fontinalis]
MWVEEKAKPESNRRTVGMRQHFVNGLVYCTGDMVHFSRYMEDKAFIFQLVEWSMRGVARVILANNPLSGVLILGALVWASPWQALLGTLGLLTSTLTAVIIGQDSSAGDWYWWLLLPVCLGGATSTFLYSGLTPLLDKWDLPVAVFPFNMVILLYLACTGSSNPCYPHHPATPLGELESNATELSLTQLLQGVPLGVGQIYACEDLGPSVLILGATLLYSPLLGSHALLGSGAGTLAGLSVSVRHRALYSGLAGFNGALGCMAVGGLFFTFSWRTHLFSIASAFLSAYADIALSNLLGTVGLPACSWAATLTTTLMLLLTGRSLSAYRIPTGRVMAPEQNIRCHSQWAARETTDSTDV